MDIEKEIILIIGNGFDLDLGLKTSYSDFIKSDFFAKNSGRTELGQYLVNKHDLYNWIDVEVELKNLIVKSSNKITITKSDFEKLNLDLYTYLNSLQFFGIKKESSASNLLNIISNTIQSSIISFNYTNLKCISNTLNINLSRRKYKHVHGEVESKSIIFGFEDSAEVEDKYCYMIKSHNPYYHSCNIRESLEKANEVIFFGHSLGETDYHYFADFFLTQSGKKSSAIQKKTIRIFTFDEVSRQNILLQLRKMNDKGVNLLFDLNDLDFYRTGILDDTSKIKQYFEDLTHINYMKKAGIKQEQ